MFMYKILIVEDDQTIAQAIAGHIRGWGCDVRCAEDFSDVLGAFVAFAPQLVLLDISLPYFNGFHWCGEIRKLSKVPILFLSSASDSMNMVLAMQMGGDDFIPKPFDLPVLTAKVQAMLRRTYEFAGSAALLEHQGAILHLGEATLSYQGAKIDLTKNEFRILQILMEQRGSVVDRDTIMTRLWETDSYIDDNTLTVNVARLRKKLESIGLTDFIRTKKGIGYQIE